MKPGSELILTDFRKLKHPQSSQLRDIFKEIKDDRNRGSRQLTTMLLEELLIWTLENDSIESEHIKSICKIVATLRPEMAGVSNTGYLLWSYYENEPDDSDPAKRFAGALRKLRAEKEQSCINLIEETKKANLPDHDVMVFSRSSTVLMLLKELEGIKKAVVLHSFPGEEGIDMAEDLRGGLDVTFAYDVEAGYFLPRVDALYIGVDALLPDGSVVNKIGSRLLARSADSTPVRAITDVWKLSPIDGVTDVPRYPSPAELATELQREHPIFETVPAKLIDTYITNRGVFHSTEDILENISDLAKAHKKL
jgi:translation initiation factor 2B subunit (eIF-2B alpha/beta/delta family)